MSDQPKVMRLMSEMTLLFTEYQTPKIIKVKNKKIAVLNRFIQLTVIAYIVGYVIIYEKGYQEVSRIQSNVVIKVKGVTIGNLSQENVNPTFNMSLAKYYNRVWDSQDIVVPHSENDGFFLTTNLIITPYQAPGVCPETPNSKTLCNPKLNNCTKNYSTNLSSGIYTGNCVLANTVKKQHVCEIKGWCPVENDELPLKGNAALFQGTRNFTVLIKNSIQFDAFNIIKRNIENSKQDETYLKSCIFHPKLNPRCPIFRVEDMITSAGERFDKIASLGGVIAINIKWSCNLDFNYTDSCFPEYSFERLDQKDVNISPGFNYRYSRYSPHNFRTLYKVYGIKFVVMVSGQGGKFSVIPLFTNIGSGVGLLAIATVICDIFMLYFVSGKKLYQEKKFQFVKDISNIDEERV